VGEDVANVYLAAIEVDGGDEAIFVAPNVKHDKRSDFIGRWKSGTQGVKIAEFGLAHDFEPAGQGAFAVGMLFPKAAERFARNDVHSYNISLIEI
jgi:hypothetical protein